MFVVRRSLPQGQVCGVFSLTGERVTRSTRTIPYNTPDLMNQGRDSPNTQDQPWVPIEGWGSRQLAPIFPTARKA